jgi:riboflavin synthase
MFTGIVEEKGKVVKRERNLIEISAKEVLEDIHIGDSILINGVCLTVVEYNKNSFKVEVMPKTLEITNLGALRYGMYVNLERALRVNSRLGGHIVTGHIDVTSKLLNKKIYGNSCIMDFELPKSISRYLIKKGSIAIDGVSLTIAELERDRFTVSLIPHTLKVTNLGDINIGYIANIEVDIIGKYIERLLNAEKRADLSLSTLMEEGYFN